MVIQQLHEIQFDIEDTIITAAISKPGEIVMLMGSGIVIRFNLEQQKGQGLFFCQKRLSIMQMAGSTQRQKVPSIP